ncbi:hypothetical protein [Halocella sp. SP3-1]|uniref:hypothetical protein n=1 Tax=Halocella sp. SP3-1 TaxID=2382161 RepID=UPI000F757BDF|nr:hypothetical protein [Halocella sp. SP3-1]AZO94011.1 hypothetical protein D7D81_05075 [Halocella sp. SP3-1]MTI59274.1 hypothetical protein [Bacillota bacterium]
MNKDNEKVNQIYSLATSYLEQLGFDIYDKNEKAILDLLINSIREEISKIAKERNSTNSKFMDFMNNCSNKTIAIFGAGNFGESVLNYIQDFNRNNEKNIQVKYILDNNSQRWGEKLYGIKIVEPKLDIFVNVDKIIIASTWKKEIKEQLLEMEIKQNKIFSII